MNDYERVQEIVKKTNQIKEKWNFELQDFSQAQNDIKILVNFIDDLSTIYFGSW